jgi:hypothetical protein
MLHGVLVAFAAFVVVWNQAPARATPDFSGNWSEVSGLDSAGAEHLAITQTGSSMRIQASNGFATSRTFPLVGPVSQAEPVASRPQVTWIGDALTITTTTGDPRAGGWQEFESYSLDLDGRLTVIRIYTPKYAGVMGTNRVVYKRD